MNNVRFATALHILTLLAIMKDELLSSAFIAGSVNVNAAVIRKEISNLKACGLVESKEGKGGGSFLARPASQIKLSEIYEAVRLVPVLGRANTPNPKCPVGKKVNEHLETLYEETDNYVVRKLSTISLEEFAGKFG
ncbi:RrF2 family transcriptional regulator [Sinomicrobium weinanense]|uniref:Rrf2 family transcriptional regulator n=1 Tax=Sinomicrobium weinanense TaxID=2842200 RepID=A0A926JR43_9FLAO|nr:Rrf2 family transcriptional regulator [Sinomicrobium weinanense]MBC9795960.1 Rrf2 family transcriptional regulator [Sinomicrobium weinanense]MBU3122079.1 Rrf2 family transcriptional regulator [Sinomicrobium weinanense]